MFKVNIFLYNIFVASANIYCLCLNAFFLCEMGQSLRFGYGLFIPFIFRVRDRSEKPEERDLCVGGLVADSPTPITLAQVFSIALGHARDLCHAKHTTIQSVLFCLKNNHLHYYTTNLHLSPQNRLALGFHECNPFSVEVLSV